MKCHPIILDHVASIRLWKSLGHENPSSYDDWTKAAIASCVRDADWSSIEAFPDANKRLEGRLGFAADFHGLSETIESMLLVPVKVINVGPSEGRKVIIQADEEWTIATLKQAAAVGLPDVADSVASWRMIYSGRIMDDLTSIGHVAKIVRHFWNLFCLSLTCSAAWW